MQRRVDQYPLALGGLPSDQDHRVAAGVSKIDLLLVAFAHKTQAFQAVARESHGSHPAAQSPMAWFLTMARALDAPWESSMAWAIGRGQPRASQLKESASIRVEG
jgi:hypothetical protein